MNRKVINGVAALCMAGMLLEPVMTVNAEELLTAGVGDLFSSELTEDQYKKIAKEAEGTRWGYTELGICNVEENNLNVRQEPGENGKLVGKLPKEAACEILKEEGDWTYIKSGKVEGYVKTVPVSLEEAAAIDGATPWETLWKVKLPMVMPSITICVFLTLTNSFKLFDQNLALTGGDPNHMTEMMALNIYETFYGWAGAEWLGLGQSKAVLFCLLVIVISMIQLKTTRSREVQQ